MVRCVAKGSDMGLVGGFLGFTADDEKLTHYSDEATSAAPTALISHIVQSIRHRTHPFLLVVTSATTQERRDQH